MEKDKKDIGEEIFWYKFHVEKIDNDNYGRDRFELRVRLTPSDMYAIIKGITNYAIPEKIPKEFKNPTPND